MGIDFGIDKKGRILSINFTGTLTIQEIINHWSTLVDQNMIGSQIKGFVIDCRNANIRMEIHEVANLAAFHRNHFKYFEYKRFAYITQSPEQILLPLLLREEDDRYETMPFSTMKAAIDWVMN
jgi:hypothetical protein